MSTILNSPDANFCEADINCPANLDSKDQLSLKNLHPQVFLCWMTLAYYTLGHRIRILYQGQSNLYANDNTSNPDSQRDQRPDDQIKNYNNYDLSLSNKDLIIQRKMSYNISNYQNPSLLEEMPNSQSKFPERYVMSPRSQTQHQNQQYQNSQENRAQRQYSSLQYKPLKNDSTYTQYKKQQSNASLVGVGGTINSNLPVSSPQNLSQQIQQQNQMYNQQLYGNVKGNLDSQFFQMPNSHIPIYPLNNFAPPAQFQPLIVKCDCLERMRLKVECELDKLRGEFRKKEVELLSPIITKYANVEIKLSNMEKQIEGRFTEHEQGILLQEQTISLILNTIQQIKSQLLMDSNQSLQEKMFDGQISPDKQNLLSIQAKSSPFQECSNQKNPVIQLQQIKVDDLAGDNSVKIDESSLNESLKKFQKNKSQNETNSYMSQQQAQQKDESISKGSQDIKIENNTNISNSNMCNSKIKVEIEINPFTNSNNQDSHGMSKNIQKFTPQQSFQKNRGDQTQSSEKEPQQQYNQRIANLKQNLNNHLNEDVNGEIKLIKNLENTQSQQSLIHKIKNNSTSQKSEQSPNPQKQSNKYLYCSRNTLLDQNSRSKNSSKNHGSRRKVKNITAMSPEMQNNLQKFDWGAQSTSNLGIVNRIDFDKNLNLKLRQTSSKKNDPFGVGRTDQILSPKTEGSDVKNMMYLNLPTQDNKQYQQQENLQNNMGSNTNQSSMDFSPNFACMQNSENVTSKFKDIVDQQLMQQQDSYNQQVSQDKKRTIEQEIQKLQAYDQFWDS
eukprot:403365521